VPRTRTANPDDGLLFDTLQYAGTDARFRCFGQDGTHGSFARILGNELAFEMLPAVGVDDVRPDSLQDVPFADLMAAVPAIVTFATTHAGPEACFEHVDVSYQHTPAADRPDATAAAQAKARGSINMPDSTSSTQPPALENDLGAPERSLRRLGFFGFVTSIVSTVVNVVTTAVQVASTVAQAIANDGYLTADSFKECEFGQRR